MALGQFNVLAGQMSVEEYYSQLLQQFDDRFRSRQYALQYSEDDVDPEYLSAVNSADMITQIHKSALMRLRETLDNAKKLLPPDKRAELENYKTLKEKREFLLKELSDKQNEQKTLDETQNKNEIIRLASERADEAERALSSAEKVLVRHQAALEAFLSSSDEAMQYIQRIDTVSTMRDTGESHLREELTPMQAEIKALDEKLGSGRLTGFEQIRTIVQLARLRMVADAFAGKKGSKYWLYREAQGKFEAELADLNRQIEQLTGLKFKRPKRTFSGSPTKNDFGGFLAATRAAHGSGAIRVKYGKTDMTTDCWMTRAPKASPTVSAWWHPRDFYCY